MSEESQSHFDKLLDRRRDPVDGTPYFSPSFSEYEAYGPYTRYLLESGQSISREYSRRLFRITGNLIRKFQQEVQHKNLHIDIRYQGAIQSNTQVELLGDVEILAILRPTPKSKAFKSVEKLGTLLMGTLANNELFERVDYSNKINIDLQTKNPAARISVLPTMWVDTQAYFQSRREIDRGIAEYDFNSRTRRSYLPFRNIARINHKDMHAGGNLKRLIRMIRCIQLDADDPINLNHYEISCTLFNLHEKKLGVDPSFMLTLLPKVSVYLEKLVKFNMYPKVISPSRKELVFGNREEKGEEIMKLKQEVDQVIEKLHQELSESGKTIEGSFAYY